MKNFEGSISNHRLQYVLNMHSSDITGMLKRMCVDGYLTSDNYGRWTTYQIKHKVATLGDGKVATSKRKVATSDNRNLATSDTRNLATSEENLATSTGKVDSLQPKVDSSDRKVDSLKGSKVDSSDNRNLATSDVFSKRMKREELETAIMRICKENYVSKEELATILGKSEYYLKNEILNKMLKDRKLEIRFPFTVNHPHQAYKTTDVYAEKL